MPLDLPTLLLVRLCIDGFLVALYLTFVRRHTSVGGPGWWAAAAVGSAISSLGMAMAASGVGPLRFAGVVGGFTAITLSLACIWLGLRRHLGLPMARAVRWSLAGAAVMFVAQALTVAVWDVPALRRLLFVLAALLLVLLSWRDVRAQPHGRHTPVSRALQALFGFEAVVLVGVLLQQARLALLADPLPLGTAAPYVLLFITLDALVRTAVLTTLVSSRLQQAGERARRRLRDGKNDLQTLINNIQAGVMVFKPDRSIETINAAALRFFEMPAGGTRPEPGPLWGGLALLGENGQPMARNEMPFELVLATGRPVRDVLLGVRPQAGGEPRWALCNAFADNDALGGLRHVVLTFVDITSLQRAQREQKTLQVQLSQSQKMEALGTLAGGVAHDFNNILTAILGNADLARQELAQNAPSRQSLHEISTAARRGRELVRQILAFSRQQPMERQRLSMRAIVSECCVLLRSSIPPQVQLDAQCGPGDLSVHADATQLGQVLLNLGTNALHALGGQPGRIGIRVDRLVPGDPSLPPDVPGTWPGVICAQVQDSGCGMDESTRQRIFEPFFTTRKLGTGTGLGLPVVLGIVQSHEGTIAVRSEPGTGSSFLLYLPAAVADPGPGYVDSHWPQGGAEKEDPAAVLPGAGSPVQTPSVQNTPMSTEPHTPNQHVLYLDDDDTLVFLVKRLLQRRGYTVTTFTDQQEAIEAVRAQPEAFHLFMTDYNMPGMSGLDVARAVLALNPLLPVAVASGYITDELQAAALAAGVREVVFKTDAVEDFCAVVARLAGSADPA